MVKNHLTRLTAPKSWPIRRKGIKFITKPNPGSHNLRESIPMAVALRELLKYAKTTREVKKILNESKILINGKIRKDHKYPLGNMDVMAIPDLKESYMLIKNIRGKFKLIKIENSKGKLYKISDKKLLNKSKVQLNFFNGDNLIVEKDDYKTGDSIIVNLKDKKISKHLKFEKGARVYISRGNRVGMIGKVTEVKTLKEGKDNIVFETDGKNYETAKKLLEFL